MEIWKDIKGYEGFYQVSNTGKVKSLPRKVKTGIREYISKKRILKPQMWRHGYQFVCLSKKGKVKQFSIHRLVALAFVEGHEEGMEVNHINEVKTDNNASNLEWLMHKRNINHGSAIQRRVNNSDFKGENNPMFGRKGKKNRLSKPIKQFTISGQLVKRFDSVAQVKEELGYNASSIASAARGLNQTSYGYKWKYQES